MAIRRHEWADVSRGACVILVVALHIYGMFYVTWFAGSTALEPWDVVVSAALPVRMPLFFIISGYFATRAIYRPWRDIARSRVWSIVYLYVLWVMIFAVVRTIRAEVVGGASVGLRSTLLELIWPASTLWYLYALVAYFVVVKATSRLPLGPLVVTAAVISMASTSFLEDSSSQYVGRCLVFFMIGARAPEIVERVVRMSSWRRFIMGSIFYAVFAGATLWAGREAFGLITLTGTIGIAVALWLASLLQGSVAASILGRVGKRTLPIFVLHPVLIWIGDIVLATNPVMADVITSNVLVAWIFPAAATATVVIMSLAIESGFKRVGAGLLFRLPARQAAA